MKSFAFKQAVEQGHQPEAMTTLARDAARWGWICWTEQLVLRDQSPNYRCFQVSASLVCWTECLLAGWKPSAALQSTSFSLVSPKRNSFNEDDKESLQLASDQNWNINVCVPRLRHTKLLTKKYFYCSNYAVKLREFSTQGGLEINLKC